MVTVRFEDGFSKTVFSEDWDADEPTVVDAGPAAFDRDRSAAYLVRGPSWSALHGHPVLTGGAAIASSAPTRTDLPAVAL